MRQSMTQPLDSRRPRAPTLVPLAAALAMLSLPAVGGTLQLGENTSMAYTVTTSYGLGVRVDKADPVLTANLNGDDGNRNFDRGSLVNNRASLLATAQIKHGMFGMVFGATGFYDDAYLGTNDNTSADTINKSSGPVNRFSREARKYNGKRARLLDAYVYGGWDIGEQKLDVRLGNHVVAWGESLFLSGISGAQGPVDATKASVPGVEVKDILLPVPQVSAQLAVTSDLSLLGYYQFRFREYELNPVGSFFSTSDIVGPGAEFFRTGPGNAFRVARSPDELPRDSGQGGLGARYRVTPAMEVSAYHLRYHDKVPSVIFNANGTYNLKYFDDIKLTGLSISTGIGDWQVSGEISYKDGVPVYVVGGTAPVRAKATQTQVSWIKTFGSTALAPSSSFAGELGWLHVNKVAGGATLSADKDAYALGMNATLNYPGVANGWDLSVPINYSQQYKSSAVGTFGYSGNGDRRASVGAVFKYLANLEVGVAYIAYLGSAGPNRTLADRDLVTVSAKYSF